MRKRKGKFTTYKPEKIVSKPKKVHNKTKVVTGIILVSIFCLILFLNSYYNLESGTVFNPDGETVGESFFLAGPDPYLNMRHVEQTFIQGRYPFIQPHSGDADPLLNYPVNERGSRPPLFNMMAVGSAMVLQNFMPQVDALGWAMVFLPAIYGALLVFPLYGITRELFNRKVGLVAAFLLAIIPIHIGGSHGSTLSLFDHDSFLLLLFTCIFYFCIKMLKEKDKTKSILYSCLAGVFVGAVYLTWTAAQFIFTLLLLTLFILFIFNLLKSKYDIKIPLLYSCMFLVALCISLPWIVVHQDDVFGFPTMCLLATVILTIVAFANSKLRLPWILSIPILGILGVAGTSILYLIHLGIIQGWGAIQQLAITIFGEGIYGSKVSLTVAEAHNFGMSQSIMSFGPVLYWIGLMGVVLYIIKTHKEKWQAPSIFILSIFLVDFWLTTTAGRFLNDLIPTIVIFAAFCMCLILDKIDYKKLAFNMQNYEGFRKYKAVRYTHILGIIFVVFLIVLPNSFMALDAAVPAETKEQVFGAGYEGAFGNSNSKTIYWVDAFSWLSKQDINIIKDEDKPAFISWWDYGFYEAAVGKHPTVADNYQVGLYAAGNFKLSASEEEAVSVLIVRCCEGNKGHNNGSLTEKVKDVIKTYLPFTVDFDSFIGVRINKSKVSFYEYPALQFIRYIEEPTSCPSYNTLIAPEYGNTVLRKRADNALYQDCWKLMQNLTDKEITNFYKDIQQATGYSIRYYGTEQYDTQIFGVFTFLTDRGTQGFLTAEDDYYIELYEDTNSGYKYERWQIENWTDEQFEGKNLVPITERKDAIYETLWYRTYYGIGEFSDRRLPTYGLKHFKLAYYSPVIVISKYYEGATINGSVLLDSAPYPGTLIYVFDEYGVPHDSAIIDSNGTFSLLAPAGNISFKVFVGQQLNDLQQSKTVNITEEEGRQLASCNKTVTFNFEYANVLFSVDTNKQNLTLSMRSQTYQTYHEYQFNNSYAFDFTDMIPDGYDFAITNSTDAVLYDETIFIKPGDNSQNVTV